MKSMEDFAAAETRRVKSHWGEGYGDEVDQASYIDRMRVGEAMDRAAQIYKISTDIMIAKCSKPYISEARQAAMLFARLAGVSFKSIGLVMQRDHTTVLHGVRAAKKRLGVTEQ